MALSSKVKQKYTDRTIAIIKRHGRIVLKDANGWYLHCWTNIAAGPDCVQWGKRKAALEIFNLEWAFAIAPLYNAKAFSVFPKGR